ncbi:hypothetical protein PybrP1_005832 [[Pythium] brassicae (nom. inval.)]|nr:hypothetical protein PybrP1_005832 [[Pythium] brassicae (nom. inval.)]
MPKSLAVAYALWLVGSWMGLHHLYLRRPRAAFLHTVTLNMLGVGWWRDLLLLPRFVAQANNELASVATATAPRPPVAWLVVVLQIALAHFFGSIASSLLPRGSPVVAIELLCSFGVAWGVWFSGVALESRVAAPLTRVWAVVLATTAPAFVAAAGRTDETVYRLAKAVAVLLAVAVFWHCSSWAASGERGNGSQQGAESERTEKREPPDERWWRTLLTYYALLGAFAAAVGVGALLHGEVTVNVNGRTRTYAFAEAAENVLRSEDGLFEHFSRLLFSTHADANRSEPRGAYSWQRFQDDLDISGRKRYLRVLGLDGSAAQQPTPEQIKRAYKRLVLQWHPDKYVGEHAELARETFFQVQEAFEKLQEMGAVSTSRRQRAHPDEL